MLHAMLRLTSSLASQNHHPSVLAIFLDGDIYIQFVTLASCYLLRASLFMDFLPYGLKPTTSPSSSSLRYPLLFLRALFTPIFLAMKKSSPPSSCATTNSILPAVVLIAVFLFSASCIWLSDASSSHEASSAPLCDHRRLHYRCSCSHHADNSFSTWHPPPSWCLPFPRGRLQPPPPPPPMEEEIDPRYGVEKRLVPTGPNPLHN